MISTYINLQEYGLDNKIQVLTLTHVEAVDLIQQLLFQLANQAKEYSAPGILNKFVIRGTNFDKVSNIIFNIDTPEVNFEEVDRRKSQGI